MLRITECINEQKMESRLDVEDSRENGYSGFTLSLTERYRVH